jgi:hypothetical protein
LSALQSYTGRGAGASMQIEMQLAHDWHIIVVHIKGR